MIDTTLRGIDVSTHQGAVNWGKVRTDGIRFAMLKATQGRGVANSALYLFTDSCFAANVRGAEAVGVKSGAYHYLTAQNEAEAVREAKYFLSVIKPYRNMLPLGAAVDVEDDRLPRDRVLLTKIVRAFCSQTADAGVTPMVYTNPDFLTYRMVNLVEYGLWLALWRDPSRPPSQETYPNLCIWQWGTETVNGITGMADANFGISGLLDSCPKTSEDYADAVCRLAGLSETTKDYLKKYKWSEDLFRKLYQAMKGVQRGK